VPHRIVSLVPSVTELLAQWGQEHRLVGRTRYCVEPRRLLETVPALGGTKDPELDRIIQLSPDLVILERDENTRAGAEALSAAGLRTFVLEIRTLRDVQKAWVDLSVLLGIPLEGQRRVEALEALLPKSEGRGPRTIALVWCDPWILAGPDTYLGDLVQHAGFRVVGPQGYPRLSLEELRALEPEVVLLPTDPFPFSRRHQRELQSRLPGASVHILDGRAVTWFLSRTEEGLRMLQALRIQGAGAR